MEEELRIYVGKYPEKAAEFLRSAKTVFKEAMESTQRQEMKKRRSRPRRGEEAKTSKNTEPGGNDQYMPRCRAAKA